MRTTWHSGLVVLGVGGTCCFFAMNCTDAYIGGLYEGDGGGGAGGNSSSSSSNGDTCSGTCQPSPNVLLNVADFVLLGFGPADQEPPPCPSVAPTDGFVGRTDLEGTAPAECAPCSCQPPKGSCTLPTTINAYDTAVCPAPIGAPFQSFDAPIPWDGLCTTANAIPSIPDCTGTPCIQGLTIEPPVVTDPPSCEPDVPSPPKVETPHWGHSARACRRAEPPGQCLSAEEFCTPTAPAGWLECILRKEGPNLPCYGEWSDRHVIYKSRDFKDTRGCTECTCGAPIGSKCVTSVLVYTDDCCGCSAPGAPALISLTVDSTSPNCGGVPSGSALGSKEATPSVYQPGKCTALGGGSIGEVTGDDSLLDSAVTACCRTYDIPR